MLSARDAERTFKPINSSHHSDLKCQTRLFSQLSSSSPPPYLSHSPMSRPIATFFKKSPQLHKSTVISLFSEDQVILRWLTAPVLNMCARVCMCACAHDSPLFNDPPPTVTSSELTYSRSLTDLDGWKSSWRWWFVSFVFRQCWKSVFWQQKKNKKRKEKEESPWSA